MKYFYSLVFILTSFAGFSQSLPITFEGDITTSDFVDFDGGTAIVTSNVSLTGINTSPTVAQIVRDGGAIWGGSKILLSENLDFSELTKISMKVFTTAPIGTIVKFKLEGSGPSIDVDATTTVSGQWEELEWVFVGTPNNLNEIVFMFDFGNQGDGSTSSTFYFDDIEQILGPTPPTALSLPIDFEMGEVATDFLNYSGAVASIIPNPQVDGVNPSPTVGQVIRDGGQFWAGSKLFIDATIDLSSLWQISMKVYTTAPVGTRIKLELSNSGASSGLDYITTVSGQWETATWNFNGQANNFDAIQFLFDFGNVGDGSEASTFLFDDILQEVGLVIPEPTATDFPIDFEENFVTSDFINEDGAIATVISNPQIDANNPSATVGQFIRSGGAPWAKSKLTLTDFIPDFSTVGSISMKVYTDAPVGTILKFKIESNIAGFADERDALTTVSGQWATYTWDFTNFDSPIYNVLTLMLGYDSPNDASANATFLFDDIERVITLGNGNEQAFNPQQLSVYPNPAKDKVTISSNDTIIKAVVVYDVLGKHLTTLYPKDSDVTINVANFTRGLYIVKVSTLEAVKTIKLIIQ
ncbi:T9SS type A sorting domain-containing protein [Flavobacteriaceae bacterium]|nr:T9SS type A sorting domain-containing protein [Flavobacteriaceae bacterium]